MRAEPLRLLFVCTANIARSPYAERRARMLLGGAPIEVESAGMPGMPGRAMDGEMAAELEDRGGDPSGHVSRSLTEDMLAGTDVLLTFEFVQNVHIIEQFPEAAERTFGVTQFAEAVGQFKAQQLNGRKLIAQARAAQPRNSMGWDFDDPHRRGRRAAKVAAEEIDAAVETIIRGLLDLPAPVGTPRRAAQSTSGHRFWRR